MISSKLADFFYQQHSDFVIYQTGHYVRSKIEWVQKEGKISSIFSEFGNLQFCK